MSPDRDEHPEVRSDGGEDRSIEDIAHEYLRATDEHEAAIEEFLADLAEKYYEPGYITDDEWELGKSLLREGDHEHVLMLVEIAAYRKAATELGREDEIDEDWPAKGGESGAE